MKKALAVSIGVLVLVLAGGALLVRSLLDPEHVRQMLERQASARLGQPVAIGRADVSFWPRAGVTLTNLVVGQPAAVTLARTEVSTAMRALLSRRIEDAEVLVEDSVLDLPLLLGTLDRLSSGGGAPVAAGGGSDDGPSKGVTLVNVRSLALRGVRVRAGDRSAVVNMESSLDGDRLEIRSASVASDVTSLSAAGTIESLAGRKGRLTITAEALDLDGLVVFAQEFARQAVPPGSAGNAGAAAPPAGPMDLTLVLEAARGNVAGMSFERLAATAAVTPGGVSFDPLSVGVFGGRLDGSMRVDLSGVEPALAVTGSLAGVEMARLTEFAGQPGSVTGTLSGSLSAAGRGTDPARALARARGQGSATITDGTIKGLQLVRPIVLAFGKPDAAQPVTGGERFARLTAAYSLADGIVTLSDLAFDSRDVELDGGGTFTVEGRALDIRADAKLSKELTAQAGRDLVRYAAEGGQVTLPVTVTGTIEAPHVGVSLGEVAGRAVKNELRRRTESAVRGLLQRTKPKK
ncbi:MAG: AsmA family protein [Acidobacteria bacterium]|nr:AsmA family protein [Acidobacteriota bacterium]